MKTILQRSQGAKLFVFCCLLAVSFGTYHYHQKIQNRQLIKDGVQTCFSRVTQSFTARMIHDLSSDYLKSNFLGQTQKCFTEGIGLAENVLAVDKFKNIISTLHGLSKEVMWFNQMLSSSENNFVSNSTSELDRLSTKFSKLEDLFYDFSEGMGNKIHRSQQKGLMFQETTVGLVVGLILLSFFEIRRRRGVDDEVFVSAHAKREIDHQKKFEIKSEELEVLEEMINTPQDTLSVEKYHSRKIQKITEKSFSTNGFKNIELDQSISRVISLCSEKLSNKEISLKFEVDEDIYIYGDDESIQQIFYHTINNSIESLTHSNKEKRTISITARKENELRVLTFKDNGAGFDESFLGKDFSQIEQSQLGVGLRIIDELTQYFGGGVLLNNVVDSEGNVEGAKVELYFRDAPSVMTSSSLVSLIKGKKKDIVQKVQKNA